MSFRKYLAPLTLLASVALFNLAACGVADAKSAGGSLHSVITVTPPVSGTHQDDTVSPNAGTATIPGPDSVLDREEAAFLTLINEYRAQFGLTALQVSPTLTRASKWMSADMAGNNIFSHSDSQGRDPFIRMAAFGYGSSGSSAENIAAGHASAKATFEQWRTSEGHNTNMLGANYRVIGIGRATHASSAYGWYWTTDFGSKIEKTQ